MSFVNKLWLNIICKAMPVMKNGTVVLFLSMALSSCFLISRYRRTEFMYNEGAQSFSIPVVVPKGFTREKTEVDSSGNTILSYTYKNNAFFYVAHMVDTSVQIQPMAAEDHIPRRFTLTGGLVYKGMDKGLYWREIRQNDIWVGYRFVPREWESRFDSATNYAVVHPVKKD